MKKDLIKNYKQWLNEDAFAQTGVAPAGNLGGTMGNPVPPSASSTGSGDTWPSLGAPSTQVGARLRKAKRKKKSRSKFNSYEKSILKNSLQQESLSDETISEEENPSLSRTIGYPSRVAVSGESTEKNQEAIIRAIQEADPNCKGINAPKPKYYPATGKVAGIMDSTCLRALSVALRKIDTGLKAQIIR